MTPDSVSLLEPEAFENGVPHALFDWLREHEPVHWNPGRPERERAVGMIEPEQRGFWVLTRHADVVAVLETRPSFPLSVGPRSMPICVSRTC